MFDLVTVGHFTIDSIYLPNTVVPTSTLGGPATYASLAALRLDKKVSVISKVGEDFGDEHIYWLSSKGLDLSGLKRVTGSLTTRFILRYEGEERLLQLKGLAPFLDHDDVSKILKAKSIHIAPVANEVSTSLIDKLRELTDVLSLDPQGFVRRIDMDGHVILKEWSDFRILEQIDVYKSSLEEIRVVTGLRNLRSAMKKIQEFGAKSVIVTEGRKGSTLLFEGSFYDIPSFKLDVVQDTTGAGDVFIGGFLAEYINKKDPVWCACVGSAAASFVLKRIGPLSFGEKKEVYERATEIHKL